MGTRSVCQISLFYFMVLHMEDCGYYHNVSVYCSYLYVVLSSQDISVYKESRSCWSCLLRTYASVLKEKTLMLFLFLSSPDTCICKRRTSCYTYTNKGRSYWSFLPRTLLSIRECPVVVSVIMEDCICKGMYCLSCLLATHALLL